MTDDKELLELAAKAAGMTVLRSRLDDHVCKDLLVDVESKDGQIYSGWNPLTDDGDRYRLALSCKLFSINNALHVKHLNHLIKNGMDFDPAFGLAIVNAAAEIGSGL